MEKGAIVSSILETVLKTILIDIINAQNTANIRSAQLAKEYMGQGNEGKLLKFFDVPSANIKSFDLELKFGLESVTENPLSDEMSLNISELIRNSLDEFVTRCKEKYKLPTGTEDELKDLISSLWKGEKGDESIKLNIQPDSNLIADSNRFIKTLKNKINSLTDSKLFLNEKKNTPGLKAVLNVSELNSYDGEILCSININAEMSGMKAGFVDTISEKGSHKETNRKIFLAGK